MLRKYIVKKRSRRRSPVLASRANDGDVIMSATGINGGGDAVGVARIDIIVSKTTATRGEGGV
jgi:hypothetical protein